MNYDDLENDINNLHHIYIANHGYNLIGYAGDLSIGEYVYLYFVIEKHDNYLKTKIIDAKYSVIGSTYHVIAAEKLCAFMIGKDFISVNDQITNFMDEIKMPVERAYIFNFIASAFYMALETLANSENISYNIDKVEIKNII